MHYTVTLPVATAGWQCWCCWLKGGKPSSSELGKCLFHTCIENKVKYSTWLPYKAVALWGSWGRWWHSAVLCMQALWPINNTTRVVHNKMSVLDFSCIMLHYIMLVNTRRRMGIYSSAVLGGIVLIQHIHNMTQYDVMQHKDARHIVNQPFIIIYISWLDVVYCGVCSGSLKILISTIHLHECKIMKLLLLHYNISIPHTRDRSPAHCVWFVGSTSSPCRMITPHKELFSRRLYSCTQRGSWCFEWHIWFSKWGSLQALECWKDSNNQWKKINNYSHC